MSKLLKPEAVAAELGIDVETFLHYRQRNSWPCVKFGRNEFRFTAEQVDQIIAQQTRGKGPQPSPKPSGRIAGQTARSAARSRR